MSDREEMLTVCLNAIERKADIIRMAAAVPPQNQNTKRQAGEIMSLAELSSPLYSSINFWFL